MWLFDNIFLDQDTPTAMLDPLLTPEQKKAQEEKAAAEKAQKDTPTTSAESAPTNAGFDAMMNPEATTPASGVHEEHAAIDAVSFDIGGIDIPGVDSSAPVSDTPAVGGGFLSGGTATPVGDTDIPDLGMDFSLDSTPSTETTITLSETEPIPEVASSTDSSIALVQGATAVSSDAIVGTESAIEIHAEEDVHPDEVALIVATADHPPENTTLTPTTSDMTATTLEAPQTTDTAGGIFDLMGTTTVPSEATVTLTEDAPVVEDTAIDTPIFSLTSDTPTDTSLAPIQGDDIGAIDFDSTHLDARESFSPVKTEDVIARIAPSHELDASLQEMLQEFVTKLEKFKSENGDVDEEMQAGLASVTQARRDLEEEHRVRLLALEYQEKSIREKGEKKIAEKTRLEGIIRNLKKEMQS